MAVVAAVEAAGYGAPGGAGVILVILVAVAWSAALWALPDLVEWIGGDPPD